MNSYIFIAVICLLSLSNTHSLSTKSSDINTYYNEILDNCVDRTSLNVRDKCKDFITGNVINRYAINMTCAPNVDYINYIYNYDNIVVITPRFDESQISTSCLTGWLGDKWLILDTLKPLILGNTVVMSRDHRKVFVLKVDKIPKGIVCGDHKVYDGCTMSCKLKSLQTTETNLLMKQCSNYQCTSNVCFDDGKDTCYVCDHSLCIHKTKCNSKAISEVVADGVNVGIRYDISTVGVKILTNTLDTTVKYIIQDKYTITIFKCNIIDEFFDGCSHKCVKKSSLVDTPLIKVHKILCSQDQFNTYMITDRTYSECLNYCHTVKTCDVLSKFNYNTKKCVRVREDVVITEPFITTTPRTTTTTPLTTTTTLRTTTTTLRTTTTTPRTTTTTPRTTTTTPRTTTTTPRTTTTAKVVNKRSTTSPGYKQPTINSTTRYTYTTSNIILHTLSEFSDGNNTTNSDEQMLNEVMYKTGYEYTKILIVSCVVTFVSITTAVFISLICIIR